MAIIIFENGKDPVKIEQQDLARESFLQEYIHGNPELIPTYEIDENKQLFVAAREFSTESGPIDALAIDKDGEIYIVETKLLKNPDKRTVVAQALDYGAALWKHSGDFSNFIEQLNEKTRSTFKLDFADKVKSFFGLTDIDYAALTESLRYNLSEGNFKFIILMDTIEDRLKDLIVYVNQNSQFDIYAVQLQYYKHEKQEIIIPKLFGLEVKKNVYSNSSIRQRKKWDEISFFEDAKTRLEDSGLNAVRELYNYAKAHSELIWGTGINNAAVSARFDDLGTRPLFVLESNGTLRISLKYPKQEASEDQIARLNKLEKLLSQTGLKIDEETDKQRTALSIEQWQPKVTEIIQHLESASQ